MQINIMLKIATFKLLIVSIMLLFLPLLAFADVADEIKVLIEQGKAKEAYELGLKHQDQLGEARFDYAFGVAAIDSGRVSLGVLSLERVLLANPGDDLVRLELARGYYNLGDYPRAKDEFNEVLSHKPPSGVVNTINIYLDLIKAQEKKDKVNGTVYAEFGLGYNTNVNAATAVNNIILPVFGPVQLADNALAQASNFSFMSAGGSVNVPLDTGITSFTSISTTAQKYAQVDGYDLNVTNALTGIKFDDGVNLVKIAGFGTIAQIDQMPVPDTLGAGVQYERVLSPQHAITVSGSSSQLIYPTQYNVYNSNLSTTSLSYRLGFPQTPWVPVLVLSGNYAFQDNIQNAPQYTRRITGANLTFYAIPGEKWGLNVGAGYAKSNYDGQDLLYQAYRTDGLTSLNAMLEYKLTKNWSTRLEATFYNNQSNLSLYSYQQATGALKLRYAWDF
jgi:tetratricopeptide (TPR) repeat protein